MKIYTKKGDQGLTSLIGGTKVPKSDERIDAYGTVDELNAHIGLVRALDSANEFTEILHFVQDRLFVIGSILANDPEKSSFKLPSIEHEDIERLENSIDELEQSLSPLKNFILPGSNAANAYAHVCRVICRRAERKIVALNLQHSLDPIILKFINRLSDWFFVLARIFCLKENSEEILWTPRS